MLRSILFTVGLAGAVVLAGCASATPEPELGGPEPAETAAGPVASADTAVQPAAPAVSIDSAGAVELGRRVTDLFWTADGGALWPLMGEELRSNMVSPEVTSDRIFGFISQFGTETEVVSESVKRDGETFMYQRVVRVDAADNPWNLGWRFDRSGTLVDVQIGPAED